MKQLLLIVYFLTSLITSDQVTSQSNEKKKVELAALEFVLSEESLKLYKEMSDSGKIIWANRFWRAMDPTPTTNKNEYYLEFRERFDYAFENYHNITAPYYLDDRAKYYIKYGQPDDYVESVGIGKFYKDNITWAYYNFNLFIDFVDFSTYGYDYLVIPYLKIKQDNLPEGLLKAIGDKADSFHLDYLKVPFRQQYGKFSIEPD